MNRILLAASAALSLGYAALFGGPMDGTAWEVRVKSDSLFAISHRDTLTFQKGKLGSANWLSSGFSPAVYRVQSGPGDIDAVWNASLSHPEKGIMSWQGLVRGDRIEGVAVLWTPEGRPKRFTFQGRRKAA